jgi:predicted lipoprotein with Yx(FWY)xxD motif
MQQDDFGTIRRPEGKMQNTFRGMPLYYYAMDRKPGDTMGHKMNNLWFVIDPLKFVAPEKQLYGNSKPAVGKE